jgi:thioredoxin reductase (NADPH)
MTENIHDMVIIGGGPAGLTAGIYASRALMNVVLYEKGAYGGQMLTTSYLENYPGFPDGIGGFELADLMHKQAEAFELPVKYGVVDRIKKNETLFILDSGSDEIRAKTVVIATGAVPNKLGVPGEGRLTGRGVSYCATCDGALYRDRTVAVIGGGDSAVEEALFLTRFASRVHIVHRRDELRAVPLTARRALENDRIKMEWNAVLTEVHGDDEVKGLTLKDVNTDETRQLEVDGVFIYVGITPITGFVADLVKLDEGGYILTDKTMTTSVPGLYAAGDVRSESIRQVSSAVGDGATAAFNAYKYLEENNRV